jgi:hypothetical protein
MREAGNDPHMAWPERPSLGIPSLFLALGILGAGYLVGSGVQQLALARQTVTVKGYAEQEIRADYGVWSATVTARAAKLPEATRLAQNHAAAVTKFLEDQGVPAAQIELEQVVSYPMMRLTESGQATSTVESYVVSQRIRVGSSDVGLMESLTKKAPDLLLLGFEVALEPTRYFRQELGDLKIELLGRAMADAQARAEKMAAVTGRGLGRLRSTSQGVFQVTAASSTEISSTGELDTSAVVKKIRSVVTAEFELK